MSIYNISNEFLPIKEKAGTIRNTSTYTVEYAITSGMTPTEGSGVKIFTNGRVAFNIETSVGFVHRPMPFKTMWLRIIADDGITVNIPVDSATHDSAVDYDISGISKWAMSKEYAADQIVLYENALYRCLYAHTSSTTFDASYWSIMNYDVGYSEIKEAVSQLDNLEADMKKVSEYKTEATTAAETATTKASEASESASTATEKATLASTYADNAKASAEASVASESNAAKSATSASESATLATTKANLAKEYADSAIESENKALAYANASEANKNTASTMATTATTQAGIATAKASEASTSASNANTSEANAKASETNAKTSEANAKSSEDKAAEYLGDIKGMDIDELKKYASATHDYYVQVEADAKQVSADKDSAAESAAEAKSAVSGAMRRKGSVQTYANLPTTATSGDVWKVLTADSTHSIDAGDCVVWDGSAWVNLSGFTNADGKADKATTLAGYGITDAYTQTEIDTALASKANKATTLAGYGITDAQSKLTDAQISNINNAITTSTISKQSVASATKATQDASGNVITTTYATKAELATAGKVKTVNGVEPDTNGNIEIDIEDEIYIGTDEPDDYTLYINPSGDADVYNKTEVDTKLATKQDKLTTAQLANVNKTFATVATSGSYNDLTNKPTIPAQYVLPSATASTLGGVKVSTGTTDLTEGSSVLEAGSFYGYYEADE